MLLTHFESVLFYQHCNIRFWPQVRSDSFSLDTFYKQPTSVVMRSRPTRLLLQLSSGFFSMIWRKWQSVQTGCVLIMLAGGSSVGKLI